MYFVIFIIDRKNDANHDFFVDLKLPFKSLNLNWIHRGRQSLHAVVQLKTEIANSAVMADLKLVNLAVCKMYCNNVPGWLMAEIRRESRLQPEY